MSELWDCIVAPISSDTWATLPQPFSRCMCCPEMHQLPNFGWLDHPNSPIGATSPITTFATTP